MSKMKLQQIEPEYIWVCVLAGADITRTIRDAVLLAMEENLPVRFSFNGVNMKVDPGEVVSRMVDAYNNRVSKGGKDGKART